MAQAGTPLQKIQEPVGQEGYMFPLDLGARGSCTIGGNISTNADGNRVIRYGMTRDLILGLEVVTADGTVLQAYANTSRTILASTLSSFSSAGGGSRRGDASGLTHLSRP